MVQDYIDPVPYIIGKNFIFYVFASVVSIRFYYIFCRFAPYENIFLQRYEAVKNLVSLESESF